MPEPIEIQLKKGVLGFCVLALLSRSNSYAYEIASKLSAAVDMGEGTIYPLMRRMQSDGLVATYLEESPSGPPRKYYRLTDAGRNALAQQLAEWRNFTASVEELIAGLEHANSLEQANSLELANAQANAPANPTTAEDHHDA